MVILEADCGCSVYIVPSALLISVGPRKPVASKNVFGPFGKTSARLPWPLTDCACNAYHAGLNVESLGKS